MAERAVLTHQSALEDILNVLCPDEEAAREDLRNLADLDSFTDDLNAWQSVFIYQGFNARRIIQLMIQRNRAALANEIVLEIDMGPGVNGFSHPANATLASDVKLMLAIFAARGSGFEKLQEKSRPGVAALMEHLAHKYNLSTRKNVAGAALAPDIITLPRIAACFPGVYVHAFARNRGKVLMSQAELGLESPIPGIMTTFSIACVPGVVIKRSPNAHWVFFAVHVLSDNVLHRNPTQRTPLEKMCTYYAAAFRSDSTPDLSRLFYSRQYLFTTANQGAEGARPTMANSQINPVIMRAAAVCRDRVAEVRASDPYLTRLDDFFRDL